MCRTRRRSASSSRQRACVHARTPPPAYSPPTLPAGHLNPAAAGFQPPGPPAPAARPQNLLAAKQEASGRTVRAPEPAQETTGAPFDLAFTQRVQAARAARVTVAAHTGLPQAALDALVAGQTREQ